MGRRTLVALTVAAAIAVAGAAGPAAAAPRFPGKKVLYVDSYDAGYEPSRIQQAAIRKILEPAGVTVEVVYLDEKRKGDPKSLKEAAAAARRRFGDLGPDVVVAADDAASQYFVVPYLKGSATPVVFLGVNWDVETYGYPFPNVTGQIEVEVVGELIDALAKLAKGPRAALLAGDTLTDRNSAERYEKVLGIHFAQVRLVKTYAAWKEAYRELQEQADLVVFRNNSGIDGWDNADARAFVLEQTVVPSGTVSVHLAPWVLVSFAKVNAEFGEWAGQTVLKILSGVPPSAIPIAKNRKARVTLNMALAKRLGVVFPMDLLDRAAFVDEP